MPQARPVTLYARILANGIAGADDANGLLDAVLVEDPRIVDWQLDARSPAPRGKADGLPQSPHARYLDTDELCAFVERPEGYAGVLTLEKCSQLAADLLMARGRADGLDFRVSEAEASEAEMEQLLAAGVVSDDDTGTMRLTVDSEEDRSVGIPYHAWLDRDNDHEIVAAGTLKLIADLGALVATHGDAALRAEAAALLFAHEERCAAIKLKSEQENANGR